MFQFDFHRAAQGQRCRGRLIFYLVHTTERDLNSGEKKKKQTDLILKECVYKDLPRWKKKQRMGEE